MVEALVANDSKAARDTLAGLLGGSIQVADDRRVVTALLQALARGTETADDDLLLAALVEKTPRDEAALAAPSGAPAVMSASELQNAAAVVFQAAAPERLRLRLAKRILQPGVPAADRVRWLKCLKEPRPENLAAQACLFADSSMEPQVVESFQQSFAQFSSAALASLSGIPLEQGPGTYASPGPYAAAAEGEDRWRGEHGCAAG